MNQKSCRAEAEQAAFWLSDSHQLKKHGSHFSKKPIDEVVIVDEEERKSIRGACKSLHET